MPRCEGHPPDGVCPAKIISNSVALCQADLMLCKECDDFHFPSMPPTKSVSVATPVNKPLQKWQNVQTPNAVNTREKEKEGGTKGGTVERGMEEGRERKGWRAREGMGER